MIFTSVDPQESAFSLGLWAILKWVVTFVTVLLFPVPRTWAFYFLENKELCTVIFSECEASPWSSTLCSMKSDQVCWVRSEVTDTMVKFNIAIMTWAVLLCEPAAFWILNDGSMYVTINQLLPCSPCEPCAISVPCPHVQLCMIHLVPCSLKHRKLVQTEKVRPCTWPTGSLWVTVVSV